MTIITISHLEVVENNEHNMEVMLLLDSPLPPDGAEQNRMVSDYRYNVFPFLTQHCIRNLQPQKTEILMVAVMFAWDSLD